MKFDDDQRDQSPSRERAKEIVESICGKIEADRETRSWESLVNALNLISQVVFTRSSGCILELIQNAEDAGQGIDSKGSFQVSISPTRLKVTHNARPFSEADVNAICAINSSKKPERGTLGYLGIGFKSVFKLTDRPEIYSRNFQFKFERPERHAERTPWQIIPHWIDEPSERVAPEKTTFVLPFRDKEHYTAVLADLKQLGVELFLFLHWIRQIDVADQDSKPIRSLERVGETNGVTRILCDGQEHSFKIFRRTVEVSDEVKGDRLTEQYRANVTHRQIAVAFELDTQGNLSPSERSAGYGGVYSFVPLGEAKSGVKFAIQADFLVQPGRDAINYEAKWNEWLLDEVVKVCRQEVVPHFKQHEKWKYQILPAFEFSKAVGNDSYERLFGPHLIAKLEKFIDEDACVPTRDGSWALPTNAVIAAEDGDALKALVSQSLFAENEIAPVFGGAAELTLAHPSVRNRTREPLREIHRRDLFNNADFLQTKAKSPQAAKWFRSLYFWLSKHPKMESYRPYRAHYDRQRPKRYYDCEIILAADNSLHSGGEVLVPNLSSADPVVLEASRSLHENKPVLHPDVLSGDETEIQKLKGFLTGLTGAQFLDAKTICRDAILPKIMTSAPQQPTPDELIKLTRICCRELGHELQDCELWVLTKSDDVRPAKEVLLSKQFNPTLDWETNQKYVPGLCFLSSRYLEVPSIDYLATWREFFKAGGVKESPDNGVETFAMGFAIERLGARCKAVTPVESQNYGYDLNVEMRSSEKIVVEVKGRSDEQEIELTPRETEAADLRKNTYFLCVVASIPHNPSMHMIGNPAGPGIGKKDKLRIPVTVWREFDDSIPSFDSDVAGMKPQAGTA